ncbi:hypothetical protein CMI37_30870 [Candidatus Pacearchaeota archaeon]|nr:hypothetical protein [Candidatus Pacearchaeota archaeon]|tara:strand:- start:1987 stop:2199 length:213 start_codon:yes stop_codon:yes gene_type:complete
MNGESLNIRQGYDNIMDHQVCSNCFFSKPLDRLQDLIWCWVQVKYCKINDIGCARYKVRSRYKGKNLDKK